MPVDVIYVDGGVSVVFMDNDAVLRKAVANNDESFVMKVFRDERGADGADAGKKII